MNEELSDLLKIRQEKLQAIKERGINPYPYRFEKSHHSHTILANHQELAQKETPVSFAGRIVSKRDSGKTSFAHLQDEHGKIQIYVRKDGVGETVFEVYKLLDLGDIIGVTGQVFVTRTGETTLFVKELTVLSKSMRPLPVVKEKEVDGQKVVYDQVTDKEARYRQRYVDLNVNPQVREVFKKRARILNLIRSFLNDRGFLEVETPALQPLYGGAAARPFKTHHNALDIPLFLRISDELYLKRLIIGGYEKVYEICKDFRNEGMDRSHNPEFTMLEVYQAYADYSDMMQLVEDVVCHVAQALNNSFKLTYQGTDLDLSPPWKRLPLVDAITDRTGVDITGMTKNQLQAACQKLGIETEPEVDSAVLIDAIFSEKVEPHLIQPTFLTDYPVATTALAKRHRRHPDLVERFEIFINGREIGNAFTELNDPQEQRDRFDAKIEGNILDEDFIRALEYGMPPTGGLGVGLDRLVMLFTDAFSIRDVIFFPQMRPEE